MNVSTTARRCDALAGVPSNVLLFPAVAGQASRCSATAGDIITEAIQRRLRTQGAGVFPYSRSLPAVQRAVNEGLKAEDVAGPWDEAGKGQRIAEMVGASEYITILVDDYKWDPQTRTVNFTISLLRNDACDGAPLGTVSEKGVGQAPETLLVSCQEASAVSSAAEVVAEQVVNALLPVPKVAAEDLKNQRRRR